PLEEPGCESAALVLDLELDPPVDPGRPQRNAASAVAKRVVDEIAERLLEPQAVAANAQARRRLACQRSRGLVGSPLESGHDGREQLVGLEALHAKRKPPALVACDQEKVVGELRQPVHLFHRSPERLPELVCRLTVAQTELELGPEQGQRRAQLVARVRDEVALPLQAALQ